MKRIIIKNSIVDLVKLNITDISDQPNSVVVDDTVDVFGGWIYNEDDVTFSAPPDPIPTKDMLKVYAANKRWEIEVGGISFGGNTVTTDDRSKLLIEGAPETINPGESTNVKTATGWVTLDQATLLLLREAVRSHVQNCFNAEKSVSDKIDAETITTYAEIDAEVWPAND
ncbi:MAG: hypothetical protein DHS20C08_04750 [Rhodomicrobium sp.]|nr:MAG: hypothetical protein DHS20C08_04750 [Rhodomicrobium sp.]